MAPKKRCRQEESRPCFSQSQVLCAYHVLSLSPHWFVWPNTFFLAFILAFIWPDIKTEVGVVIYMNLKHSPDFIDSKYIYILVCWSNSLGSSVYAEIPFLAFLALHRERKRCGQVGPSPCYFKSEFVYAYQVLYH